jgi:hypothetical protein
MRLAVCLMVLLMTGCAGWSPFAEVGVGFQIDNRTDWWVQTQRGYQGKNPQARLAVGMANGKYSCGYYHQSWFFQGRPFNKDPEIYQDDIRCTIRWGGHK